MDISWCTAPRSKSTVLGFIKTTFASEGSECGLYPWYYSRELHGCDKSFETYSSYVDKNGALEVGVELTPRVVQRCLDEKKLMENLPLGKGQSPPVGAIAEPLLPAWIQTLRQILSGDGYRV